MTEPSSLDDKKLSDQMQNRLDELKRLEVDKSFTPSDIAYCQGCQAEVRYYIAKVRTLEALIDSERKKDADARKKMCETLITRIKARKRMRKDGKGELFDSWNFGLSAAEQEVEAELSAEPKSEGTK